MKIHHIGYLVKNIDVALREFLDLGYQLEQEIVDDNLRKIRIAFVIKNNYRVELVSPMVKSSAVGDLLKKIGNSPYHICYEVVDLDDKIKELEAVGYMLTIKPQNAPAIKGRRVAFLYNMNIGIIELLEVF